jgi:hypothetical protein
VLAGSSDGSSREPITESRFSSLPSKDLFLKERSSVIASPEMIWLEEKERTNGSTRNEGK